MADDPLASFALGSFAASRGASDLAALSVSLFAPKNDVVSLADYQALAAQYAALQHLSAGLQSHIAYLEEDRGVLERNVERLKRWNAGLNNELIELKSK